MIMESVWPRGVPSVATLLSLPVSPDPSPLDMAPTLLPLGALDGT